jgi:ubiquinone/menaquinone biosynthesis C-methylase UbiE
MAKSNPDVVLLERETRGVFDAHHREQADDDHIFNRLTTLVSAEYFGLAARDFDGLQVLDVGCGSNANASCAFLELGARVHSVDLGDAWHDCARRRLGPFGGRSTLGSESVLNLSMPDNSYDLVHCAGVLHHTADPRRGFGELVRVTRPGGLCFVSVMGNGNGALYQWINLLRDRYASEPDFRAMIDRLSAETLHRAIDWLLEVRHAREPEACSPAEDDFLHSLVDADLVLTIKDRIQAPTYHRFELTEATVRAWCAEAGLIDVRRISRYLRGFTNLRRFLSPMYLHYDHPVARAIFGDGYVQLIGTKAAA